MKKGKNLVLPSYLISETQGQPSSWRQKKVNWESQALTFDQWLPSVPGLGLSSVAQAVLTAEPPPSRVHRAAVTTPRREKPLS